MSYSTANKDQSNDSTDDSSEQAIDMAFIDNLELEKYVLRLFVAGTSLKSLRAIDKIRQICKEKLQGRCELEIIDIYKHPELLEKEQIVAVPTLIKKAPPPLQKFIGDMTNTEKILLGLDIWPY